MRDNQQRNNAGTTGAGTEPRFNHNGLNAEILKTIVKDNGDLNIEGLTSVLLALIANPANPDIKWAVNSSSNMPLAKIEEGVGVFFGRDDAAVFKDLGVEMGANPRSGLVIIGGEWFGVRKVTILSADVLTLFATPVEVIPTMGAGFITEVISATTDMSGVVTPYATNTILDLITDTATVGQFSSAPTASILASTVSKIINITKKDTGVDVSETQILADKAINAQVQTGNPTAGDGDLTIRAFFRVYAA